MIAHVLWGWCVDHALIYLAVLVGLFWIGQHLWQVVSDRRTPPPAEARPEPAAPSWARTPGRHRRTPASKGTTR
jgi:hypothetical protein